MRANMMMMIWLVWDYAVDDGFVLNMRMMRMAYDRVDIRKQYRVLNGIQLRSVLFSTNPHFVQFCIVSVGFNPDIELRRRSDYLVWLPLHISNREHNGHFLFKERKNYDNAKDKEN